MIHAIYRMVYFNPNFLTPQNRTYDIVWWLEERHTPRSIPAGEYRLDMKFVAIDNVTLFASETYFTARRNGILRSMIEW